MLSTVEQKRLLVSNSTASKKKSKFGQFLMPQRTASFMASLFSDGEGHCHLPDPRAGIGFLSYRWSSGGFNFDRLELDVFEFDRDCSEFLETVFMQVILNPRSNFCARWQRSPLFTN